VRHTDADMSRNLPLVFVLLLGSWLGACAPSPDLQTGTALAPTAVQTASAAPAPAYQLNEKELKMSCKKLVGTIKIRVMQMRAATPDGTLVARTMQSGAVKIFGGPTYATDPQGDHARDMAQLQAYNQQLAAKKCKTLDLQTELNPEAPVAAPAQKPNKT
jgi:hypothetical protein